MVRSGGVAGVSLPETSAKPDGPFGSIPASPYGVPSSEASLLQLPSLSLREPQCGSNMLQAAQVAPVRCFRAGLVQPAPTQMRLNMNPNSVGAGPQVLLHNSFAEKQPNHLLFRREMLQSSVLGENHQARGAHLGGSTPQAGGGVTSQPHNKTNSPFLL